MKRLLQLALALMLVSCSQVSQPFCFVQISDPQIGFNPGAERQTIDWFAQTVDKIIEISPDFVICTGDMTHNMFADKWQSEAYDSLFAKIPESIPVYYVPGNHDYRSEEWPGSREIYAQRYGDNRFCFMHKGSLFIGFDSNIIKEGLTDKEDEQFQWMNARIDEYGRKADHIFLFQHCPVVSTCVDEEDSYSNFPEPYRSKYLDFFSERGVEAVFSGHCHRWAEMEVGGVKLVNCAACGIPLGPPGTHCINVVNVTPKTTSWSCVQVCQ